jgi:hypothetical protein
MGQSIVAAPQSMLALDVPGVPSRIDPRDLSRNASGEVKGELPLGIMERTSVSTSARSIGVTSVLAGSSGSRT